MADVITATFEYIGPTGNVPMDLAGLAGVAIGPGGLVRTDTGEVLIPQGTLFTRTAPGVYTAGFVHPAPALTYTYTLVWTYYGQSYSRVETFTDWPADGGTALPGCGKTTISFNYRVDDVLTDVDNNSVVIGPGGLIRTDTRAVVVPAGTPLSKSSTGVYGLTLANPAKRLSYEYTLVWEFEGDTQTMEFTAQADLGYVSLDDAKAWLKIEDDTEDVLLQGIVDAAVEHVIQGLNAPPPEPLTPSLLLAIKLLVGHWFTHREAAQDRRIDELPIGLQAIINQHRSIPVV